LLDHSADPNIVDKKGFSPLDLLRFTRKLETKKLLLSSGGHFKHFDEDTPIGGSPRGKYKYLFISFLSL